MFLGFYFCLLSFVCGGVGFLLLLFIYVVFFVLFANLFFALVFVVCVGVFLFVCLFFFSLLVFAL